MGTRPYDFNTGFDQVSAPDAADPSALTDLVSLGYASKNYAKGVETVAALKAIGSTARTDLQPVYVEELDAWFHFDAGSSATGDDYNVITPTAGSGRWLRVATMAEGSGQNIATAATIDDLDNTKPVVRLTGSTATSLRGILAGGDNQRLSILNVSSADVTLVHESGAVGTAARRISINNSSDITLKPNGGAVLVYDATSSRWRVKAFTATGGTSWADIDGKTAETSPAKADLLYLGDASASTLDKITLENLWKVVNDFTAETSIDQASDFLAIYDATAAAIRKASVNSLLGGASAYANVGLSGNQNIGNTVWTKVAIDTSYESSNITLDSGNNRLIPTVAGIYVVLGRVWKYDCTDTAQLGIRLTKNGGNISEDWEWEAQGSTKDTTAVGVAVVSMNGSTDFIEMEAYQDTGITRTLQGANSATNLYMARFR